MCCRAWGWLATGALMGLMLAACDQAPKGTPLSSSGLKLNVKVGDTHQVRMIREERLTQGNMGSKEMLSRHLGVDCTFKVVNVEQDGTAQIALTFNAGIYKQGGDLADSDELPGIFKHYDAVENPLANIKGQTLHLIVSPDFTLLALDGMYDYETKSGLLATVAREYDLDPNQTKTDALGDYAQAWREGMGFDVGRQICSDIMDLFPFGFYDTGDFGYSSDGLGVGSVRGPKCSWVVMGKGGPLATVRTLAKLEASPAKNDSWGPPITYELSGKKKGTLVVDRAKGWIVSGRIEENYSGKKVVHIGRTQSIKYPASFERITKYEQPKP